MKESSKAYSKAKTAMEEFFPSLILPNYTQQTSIFDLIQSITNQTLQPQNVTSGVNRMKMASETQEFRIQRSFLQMDKENQMLNIDEICYQLPSTGILGQRDIFLSRSQRAISDAGDKLIDEVWWSNEKKNQVSQYFME